MRAPLAKLLATLQLTLKGTPFIYQGQELGLANVDFASINEINDVESRNLYQELCGKMPSEEAWKRILAGTRDMPARHAMERGAQRRLYRRNALAAHGGRLADVQCRRRDAGPGFGVPLL